MGSCVFVVFVFTCNVKVQFPPMAVCLHPRHYTGRIGAVHPTESHTFELVNSNSIWVTCVLKTATWTMVRIVNSPCGYHIFIRSGQYWLISKRINTHLHPPTTDGRTHARTHAQTGLDLLGLIIVSPLGCPAVFTTQSMQIASVAMRRSQEVTRSSLKLPDTHSLSVRGFKYA